VTGVQTCALPICTEKNKKCQEIGNKKVSITTL
jgi:hypothetical protein